MEMGKMQRRGKEQSVNGFEFFLAGSLEKIFPERRPEGMREGDRLCILKGEIPAVQLVYWRKPGEEKLPGTWLCRVEGFAAKARMRRVELVPSAFPCYEGRDENYLSTQPGLFPDLLEPVEDGRIRPLPGQFRSLWIDFPDTAEVEAGVYQVEIVLTPEWTGDLEETSAKRAEEEALRLHFWLEVSEETLPEQTLIHTEWFHSDCLADYYHVEPFGERHWNVLEGQIRLAGELGINMLLAPVFTPPLDTRVGGERTTVQLVDIVLENGEYRFDFARLERWCSLCRKYGISYLEIPHLFTQWGAKATPKICVAENGIVKKKFGWHVPADSPEYRRFLEAFLPALQREIERLGYTRKQVYFHISDEPSKEQLESYSRAKKTVADLLEGWQVIDALSDFAFYQEGLVEHPVPSNDHIQPFADHGVEDLWVYYCCGQGYEVPNRFFAMPSARCRIMGVLLYLYDLKGFLHWGFNFYNSALSVTHLDPYFDTHGGYAFPSGDPFLVYPGADGKPRSSIRAQVQLEGLGDLRALRLLEKKIGRERVIELIYEGQQHPFTFRKYPMQASYLYELRRKIARALKNET